MWKMLGVLSPGQFFHFLVVAGFISLNQAGMNWLCGLMSALNRQIKAGRSIVFSSL
jgi:hypothetical protein